MTNATPISELTDMRAQIDDIDNSLAALLAQRFALVAQVAAYKREHPGQTVEDTAREDQICARLAKHHPQYAAEITKLYRHLFTQSKQMQYELLNGVLPHKADLASNQIHNTPTSRGDA